MGRPPENLWTDEELASAVDVYVFLLQAEAAGLPLPRDMATKLPLPGPLSHRNEGSVRYRMRNISAVVKELGGTTLSIYSPAEQVGKNVRQRLIGLLTNHSQFNHLLQTKPLGAQSQPSSRSEALDRLAELRSQISQIERDIIGIGHNQPPEPLATEEIARPDFKEAQEAIAELQREVASEQPDLVHAREQSTRLLEFGTKVAAWAGERATKFTDVTLALLAPVLVVKVTGLAPLIVETLRAVARAIPF